MAENEDRPPVSTSSQPSKSSPPPPPPRPSITLPPRTSFEALFNGGGGGGGGTGSAGFSPGPMTLVSSFFSDADDCKSFSQLLAGAMASPAATSAAHSLPLPEVRTVTGAADEAAFRFKQNRPSELTVAQSPMFATGLLDSPGLFSPGQGPFGMSHQQALAQVTAQAAQATSNMHIQTEYLTPLSADSAPLTRLQAYSTNATTLQEAPSLIPDSSLAAKESSDNSHQDPKPQSSSFNADKPNDDGYNWRKYGQKQVKGSEFPRSYYKCTHPSCPVKKKVERSLDGQVTEIIYKGQHNHQRPQSNKRGKDVGNSNGNSSAQGNHDLVSQVQSGYFNKSAEGTSSYSVSRKDHQESSQATHEHLSATSDSEEVGDAEVGAEEKDEDEPEPKRRNTEVRHSEPASSHRTVTEPRIIVQTTSEVDLLDDGYRWRKYGQKVVKGNPYPRSYYKCTTPGCNVRKHVERASTDPKAVITTYEGKHNHDVPASKSSSHNTANNSASNQRLQNTRTENHRLSNPTEDPRNNTRQPVGRLRLKEEQIT